MIIKCTRKELDELLAASSSHSVTVIKSKIKGFIYVNTSKFYVIGEVVVDDTPV